MKRPFDLQVLVRPADKPKRGRPREFDREAGLKQAMHVFWSHGYEATSMADLRAALGVTQASLYAAYGNKEALFREAVDLYRKTDGITTERALSGTGNTREAIHAMLQDAVNLFTSPGARGGCLVVLGTTNCTVENQHVHDYLRSLRTQTVSAILSRLERGRTEGDVSQTAPLSALAAYYATVLHGLSIQAKDGASANTLTEVVACTMASWQLTAKP